jgi:bacterioferritin-associated ferredoxin
MLVCHCKRVCDRTIRETVRCGVAATSEDVGRACGAGTRCGGCRPLIDDLIEQEAPQAALSVLRVAS